MARSRFYGSLPDPWGIHSRAVNGCLRPRRGPNPTLFSPTHTDLEQISKLGTVKINNRVKQNTYNNVLSRECRLSNGLTAPYSPFLRGQEIRRLQDKMKRGA